MTREPARARRLGRGHPLAARVRELSSSPEARAGSGLLVVEGVRLAAEALSEGARIRDAIVSPRLGQVAGGPAVAARLQATGAQVWEASDSLLASLHQADSQQGILMLVEHASASPEQLTPPAPRRALVLVAIGVQDPGNMGAMVRLADAAGATGMLAAGGADPFGPKAVRASAGSVFRLPVGRVAGQAEALAFLAAMKQRGIVVAGAVPRGGCDPRGTELSMPLALVLGGEGAGLPETVAHALDLKLSIPMNPRVESINVAAAAAVLLFAAAARPARTPRAPDPAPDEEPRRSRPR